MCLSTRYNYTDERSLDTVNCAAVDEHLHHPIIKKKSHIVFSCVCVFSLSICSYLFFQRIFCVGNWLFDRNAEDQKLRITDCASEVSSLLLFLKHYFFERWKGWEMAPWRIVQKNETATEEKYELIALISIRIPYSIFIRLHSWLYCAIEDSWLFIQRHGWVFEIWFALGLVT